MERIFQILAAILAGIAAFFLWKGDSDSAFISAVLGAVCFFLSIRFQVKERNRHRELEAEANQGQLTEATLIEEEITTGREKETINN
jgi:hypothetical protein